PRGRSRHGLLGGDGEGRAPSECCEAVPGLGLVARGTGADGQSRLILCHGKCANAARGGRCGHQDLVLRRRRGREDLQGLDRRLEQGLQLPPVKEQRVANRKLGQRDSDVSNYSLLAILRPLQSTETTVLT